MATFEAKIYKLTIEDHPNADVLELARIGDYRSIVQKGQFATGDLGVYIPEGAVVPDWLIEKMGLTGRLAGSNKNRVKAVKLRGILSQGLVYKVQSNGCDTNRVFSGDGLGSTVDTYIELDAGGKYGVGVGDDVADILKLKKYIPKIPTSMNGVVTSAFGYTINYDIENIKKWNNVLDGNVNITEKLHGTWACFGWHPDFGKIVTSKGMSSDGKVFIINQENENNLYVKQLLLTTDEHGYDIIDRLGELVRTICEDQNAPFYILGEIFGPGVQDLHYGMTSPQFRVFDIKLNGKYLNAEEMIGICKMFKLDTVPVLYSGPFSTEIVDKYTNGRETVSNSEANIREGIVIKPTEEKYHSGLGRVILKSVSEKYLLRKGDTTEYN